MAMVVKLAGYHQKVALRSVLVNLCKTMNEHLTRAPSRIYKYNNNMHHAIRISFENEFVVDFNTMMLGPFL